MKVREAAVPLLLLAVALAAVFGLLAWSPFLYDDPQFITGNAKVTGPWPGWRSFFLTPLNDQGDFEHLVYLLHRWMYPLIGSQALWYRLTSIALHWLNASLAYVLYRRFLKDNFLAAASALLFALYPGHVETLAVSMYKTHLLVAFFGLGMMALTLRDKAVSRAGIALSFLAMSLALLAKETALILPCLFVLAARRLSKFNRGRMIIAAGCFMLCAFYALYRICFFPHMFHPPVGGNWPNHLATSLKCLLWYLSQFPIPWGLCFEHSLSPVDLVGPQTLLLLVSLLVFSGIFIACRRFDSMAWSGLLWMLLALGPFINIVPFLNFSLVINRYLYLAAFGFFLFSARLLQKFAGMRVQAALIGLLIFVYSAVDLRYGVLFANPADLWTRTAACAPGNLLARAAFAGVLAEQGLYPQAIAEYKKAILLGGPLGHSFGSQSGLAMAYARTGQIKKAIVIMRRFALTRPNAATLELLGKLLMQDGQTASAKHWLKKAKAMNPSSPTIRLALGQCRLQLDELAEAKKEFHFSLGFPQTRAVAFEGLARLHARRGRRKEAIGFYENAVVLGGRHPDVLYELGRLYIQDGRPSKARELYRQARAALAGSARFKPVSAENSRRLAEMTRLMSWTYRQDEKKLFAASGSSHGSH